jgi:hypothetical protein
MAFGRDLEQWALRVAHAERGQQAERQNRALLDTFSGIEDPVLREQIIVLVEIISKTPWLIQQRLIENGLRLN